MKKLEVKIICYFGLHRSKNGASYFNKWFEEDGLSEFFYAQNYGIKFKRRGEEKGYKEATLIIPVSKKIKNYLFSQFSWLKEEIKVKTVDIAIHNSFRKGIQKKAYRDLYNSINWKELLK